MSTKIKLFISAWILSLCGCIPIPLYVPGDISTTDIKWTIDTKSIDSLVGGQPLPRRILNIKWSKVDIYFKNDVCPCSQKRMLQMKVSEVNSSALKGYERSPVFFATNVPNTCEKYSRVRELLDQAYASSRKNRYYYRPSYELIWAAIRVSGPLECDIEQATSLAEKALQVAQAEGTEALGHDLTGTWSTELTNYHPEYFNGKGQRQFILHLEERGDNITGTQNSVNATLEGHRTVENGDGVQFRFSSHSMSIKEVEGEWRVLVDDNGLRVEGTWWNAIDKASGKWNMRKIGQKTKAENRNNMGEVRKKWLSRKSGIEIKWNQISRIDVWTKDVDVDWIWINY